jgi:hypothetical protein
MTDDSPAAVRPVASNDPDLGFFAAAPRSTSATDVASSAVPFGTPGRTAAVAQPVAAPRSSRTWLVALVLVVTLAGLTVVGGLLLRTWRDTGKAPQTTVSTPDQVGDLVRTSLEAPTLMTFEPDVVRAVPMRASLQASYVRGSVTAEVLAVRPVEPMDQAAQGRVVSAVSEGVDRLTGLPLQLAPVLQGTLSGPLSCSQIQLQAAVQVACVGTTAGVAVIVLVSGAEYAEATQLAAELRAGVARRS